MQRRVLDFLEKRVDALKRRDKDRDEARRTASEIFDESTLMTLYKLLSDGVLDALEFPISTGKEANVFRGARGERIVAVKIYRVATATFHALAKYITGDPRFKGVGRDRRALISTWARKEYKNLARLRSAGVRVPEPLACRSNVLVMEYIGSEERAAPMLRELSLGPGGLRRVRDVVLNYIDIAYNRARLVHGDMSEYNILVSGEDVVLIDVGQAVVLEHPMARELFARDLRNIALYFGRRGAPLDWRRAQRRITSGRWSGRGALRSWGGGVPAAGRTSHVDVLAAVAGPDRRPHPFT